MGEGSYRVIDHQKLKEFLAVCLREHRDRSGRSMAELAEDSDLAVEILGDLEAGAYEGALDRDLVFRLTRAYGISESHLQDVFRVSCVAQIIEVMKALDEPG